MYSRIYRPPTVVFDMDGTLADVSGIRHLVMGEGKKDYDAFHRESVNCPPFEWVVDSAREAHRMGIRVLQVTARSERYRPHTSWWLADKAVPSDGLFMRANRDFRPDYAVKRDMLNRLLHSYDIRKAFDDNPSIVDLWAEFDIPCVVVPGWEPYG